jgi:hypothetical protein
VPHGQFLFKRPRGKRLVARVPHRHWNPSTFVAALRCDGIEAPWVFDGPINSARFLAYVEQCLVSALRPGLSRQSGKPQKQSRTRRHSRRRS